MHLHVGPKKRKRRKAVDIDWMQFWSPSELRTQELEKNKKISLSNTALALRVVNTLEAEGILTLGDLAESSLAKLSSIPNLGYLTFKKCAVIINEYGLEAKFVKDMKDR